MIATFSPSRRFVIVAVAMLSVITLFGVTYRVIAPATDTRSYCALMPDSIGLFAGSSVTVLGVPVGTVTRIVPEGTRARVEFEVRGDRRLPPDVGATTLSQTLIADRRLALVGNQPPKGSPSWDNSECITSTATPKSMTATLTALADLSDEMNGDPSQTQDLADGLSALADGTEGTGDDINRVIRELARALNSPDAAVGRIGNLIGVLSELADKVEGYWPQMKLMLTRLPGTLVAVEELLISPAVDIVERLRYVLPQINDVTTLFGGTIIRNVDADRNLPQMISAGVYSLSEVLQLLPVYTGAFEQAIDPTTGHLGLSYTPPPNALPHEVTETLCSLAGEACETAGPLTALLPDLLTQGVVPQ